MLQNVRPVVAVRWILLQHSFSQLPKLYAHVGWVHHFVVDDLGRQVLEVVSHKGCEACEEFVDDDAERPYVYFMSIGLGVDYFWGDVEGSSLHGMKAHSGS